MEASINAVELYWSLCAWPGDLQLLNFEMKSGYQELGTEGWSVGNMADCRLVVQTFGTKRCPWGTSWAIGNTSANPNEWVLANRCFWGHDPPEPISERVGEPRPLLVLSLRHCSCSAIQMSCPCINGGLRGNSWLDMGVCWTWEVGNVSWIVAPCSIQVYLDSIQCRASWFVGRHFVRQWRAFALRPARCQL